MIKFFKCVCCTEGITVEKFEDEPDLYFALWEWGYKPRSWKWILKYIWWVIRKRKPYTDQIILDNKTALEFAEEIKRLVNEK